MTGGWFYGRVFVSQLENQDSVLSLLRQTESELSLMMLDAMRTQEDPLQRQRLLVEEERLKYLNQEELLIQQLQWVQSKRLMQQEKKIKSRTKLCLKNSYWKSGVLRNLGHLFSMAWIATEWYESGPPQWSGEVCRGASEELVSEPRPGDGAGCGAEEQRAEDAGRDAHRAQEWVLCLEITVITVAFLGFPLVVLSVCSAVDMLPSSSLSECFFPEIATDFRAAALKKLLPGFFSLSNPAVASLYISMFLSLGDKSGDLVCLSYSKQIQWKDQN